MCGPSQSCGNIEYATITYCETIVINFGTYQLLLQVHSKLCFNHDTIGEDFEEIKKVYLVF